VASTPVETDELPDLIALLADALGDAARIRESSPLSEAARPRLLAKLRLWLRPHLAQIVELGAAVRHEDEIKESD
jgi:hypothetical protein